MIGAKICFLDLPAEVRLQIYHLALKPSRLRTRPILDPEWLFAPDRACLVAPILFASKQIYYEAVSLFYARATLEITPCQRDPTDGRHLAEFALQYEDDHAFCPPPFLQAVQNVHVYCDQAWPVDQDAFQAMFQWLVTKTGVKQIYLSRKIMQQNRHVPELVCLNDLNYDITKQALDTRIIDVYARNVSSRLRFWDGGSNSFASRTKPLPDVQLYFSSLQHGRPHLYREPQWNLTMSNTEATRNKEELLNQQMERFANGDLVDVYLRQAHVDGYLWLYKTIQIHRRISHKTTSELDSFTPGSAILAF